MRHAAISTLILLSLTAGCGDSDGSQKSEDAGMDSGSSSNGSVKLPDDEDLDNACDYNPCCFGHEDYDYARCEMTDAGMRDSSVAQPDAASDAGADAGVNAGTDAGKTE